MKSASNIPPPPSCKGRMEGGKKGGKWGRVEEISVNTTDELLLIIPFPPHPFQVLFFRPEAAIAMLPLLIIPACRQFPI
jgi:hypothetical protein